MKLGRYFCLSLCLSSGLLLSPMLVSVVAANTTVTARSQLKASNKTVAQIDEIAQQITVRIDSQKSGNGSGVIVAKQGRTYYIITAAHVVQQPDQYTIVAPDGQAYPVNNAATTILEGVDIAIVTFESDRNYQLATLGDYDTDKAPWIFVSGFPGEKSGVTAKGQRLLTAGRTLRGDFNDFLVKDAFSLSNGYGLVYTNMSYAGMSGGPVLDVQGRVVGINTAAENEIEISREGQIVEISLGFSLGIPMRTFISLVGKTKMQSQWLTVETSIPNSLSETDVAAIRNEVTSEQAPPQSANEFEWLNYGNQLWRSARFDEAIAAFDRAIQLKSDFYQAYYAKGFALLAARKFAEATTAFEKTAQINPNFYQAWRLLGNTLSLTKRYSEALAAFDRAIASQPNEFVLYIERAEALRGLRRFQDAIASCNEGLKIKNHPWGYNNRGLAYMEMQDYDAALADLNRSLEMQPDYAESYSNRGFVYIQLKDFPKAFADLNKAIALSPQLVEAKNNRGLAYYYTKDYQKALSDLNDAMAIDPNFPQAYVNRGLVYTDLREYEKAMVDINKSLSLDPNLAAAYVTRSRLYYITKDYAKAMTDVNKAIELQPDFAEAYSNRGMIYVDLREFQKAIADFEKALTINPKLAEGYSNRGLAYYSMEDYPKALADFDRAIVLNPNLAQAYSNRGLIYALQQESQKAFTDLNKAIELDPNLVQAYNNRGLAYFFAQDFPKALTDYNRAIAMQSDFAQSYLGRGLVYAELKDYPKARTDFQTAQQLFQQQGRADLAEVVRQLLQQLPSN